MSSVVPDGWLKGQLSSIATLEYGKSPNHVRQEEGQYPIVGTSGIVGTANQYLWGEKSVVIGRKGTINKPIYIETPFWAIDTTYFCKFAEDTDPKWFYYKVCEEQLEKHNEASGVPSLSRDTLRGLPIEIPPLPEQKKIASILTSVDEVIENTQKQIDKLQDLKKATMNELLTKGIGHTEFKDSELGRIPKSWDVVPCSEVFDFMNGKAFYSDGYSDSGYRVMDLLNISLGGRLNITLKDKFISAELYKKFLKAQLRKDDLIFIMTDITPSLGLIGKTAIIDKDNSYVLNQRVGCFRPRLIESLYIRFFNYLFNSNVMRLQVVRETLGTAQFYINTPSVKNLLLKVPPLHEQMKITSILDSVDRRIDGQETLLLKTQSLKKSLMQDLLTGKVRVTVN